MKLYMYAAYAYNYYHSISIVKSFVEMARFLLEQEGVKFLLSERFCQDPIEEFFSQQRSRGGRNDNPTVHQFCDNTVSLRVQKTAALKPLHGNCSKKRHLQPIIVDDTPLKKRKRIAKKKDMS